MDDDVQEKAKRVDKKMSLAARDLNLQTMQI